MTTTQEKGLALKDAEGTFGFTPKTLEEAEKYAKLIADSSLVPALYKGKAGDVLAAVLYGRELGLSPFASLQSIAVINGKPAIYGDAVPGIVQSKPSYEYMQETIEGEGESMAAVCVVKRKGAPPHTVRFSVGDAKKAGLYGKPGPWQQYPKRMLQMRARGFALRDQFADSLKGLVLVEEAQDYPRVVTEAELMPRAIGQRDPKHTEAETLGEAHISTDATKDTTAPEATPAQPDLPTQGTDFITEAQRKRLFHLLKESGKTVDDLKYFLASRAITSTKEIPLMIYEVVSNFCEGKEG